MRRAASAGVVSRHLVGLRIVLASAYLRREPNLGVVGELSRCALPWRGGGGGAVPLIYVYI